MPEALRHSQLLGGQEMGAFEVRFVHQVRGPRFQSSWDRERGQVGILRRIPQADGE